MPSSLSRHSAVVKPAAGAGRVVARRGAVGLVTVLGSSLSAQVGAGIGSLAFPVIGPVGVVAVRQFVSALTLYVIARPRLRSITWRQWKPALLLALVFGGMNVSLYTAVDRVGLGLAVTLEFLGPLAVAVCSRWNRVTAGCAALAAIGVVLLTDPQPTTDWLGVGAGLVAAAAWAGYILLNREVGRRFRGLEGSAVAALLSGLLFVPVAVVTFVHRPPTAAALWSAVAVGLLSSVVPQVADLITLRRLPAHMFGLLMSAHPVFAALVGWIGLGQLLAPGQWIGIGCVIGANIGAVLADGAARRQAGETVADDGPTTLSVPRATMAG